MLGWVKIIGEIVTAIKTPVRKSPYIVRAPVVTDAIRIVLSSSMGSVNEIRLYGTSPKTSPEDTF